jgi:hypothetical protein
MTTSSTYAWSPQVGDLVLQAFSRCGIRGPELTQQHLADAAIEVNLLNVQFTNRLPMQYALETPTISLVQGTRTYALPNRTAAIGVVYITFQYGTDYPVDRPLSPLSAADYASMPNKLVQGQPSAFWLQLLPIPQITIWPVPDGNGPYTLQVQSFRQQQDISLAGGQTIDAPYRFLDAFTAGLAARLARNWAPALYALRKADFEESWGECTQRDQEDVPLVIAPGLQSYYL